MKNLSQYLIRYFVILGVICAISYLFQLIFGDGFNLTRSVLYAILAFILTLASESRKPKPDTK